MGEKCLPDELRTLFLFEALSDEQLYDLMMNEYPGWLQLARSQGLLPS